MRSTYEDLAKIILTYVFYSYLRKNIHPQNNHQLILLNTYNIYKCNAIEQIIYKLLFIALLYEQNQS